MNKVFADYAACLALLAILVLSIVYIPSIRLGIGISLATSIIMLGLISYHDLREYFKGKVS